MSEFTYPFIPNRPFAAELCATAKKIATPGKGILAADESTGTIGSRFKAINVENVWFFCSYAFLLRKKGKLCQSV
jgi:hypothetical protein